MQTCDVQIGRNQTQKYRGIACTLPAIDISLDLDEGHLVGQGMKEDCTKGDCSIPVCPTLHTVV